MTPRAGAVARGAVTSGLVPASWDVGVAESFLLHGVANFIGTYWKVDDVAAQRFAATFYGSLLDGKSMSIAMREARNAIRSMGARDWANYQHFGDPLYALRRG